MTYLPGRLELLELRSSWFNGEQQVGSPVASINASHSSEESATMVVTYTVIGQHHGNDIICGMISYISPCNSTYILCSFVYTCTPRGHEQSAFKPIVMDESELIKLH